MSESHQLRDKILICVDCKEEFAFTIGAQEYFAERGFTEDPKRCRNCSVELQMKQRRPGKEDSEGGMAVWQPKIPPGFIPPRSGFSLNVPESNPDQQH